MFRIVAVDHAFRMAGAMIDTLLNTNNKYLSLYVVDNILMNL
jgi:hypothetical protein